jgi:hypothetical protein
LNDIHQKLFSDSQLPYDISICPHDTIEKFGVSGAGEAMARLLGIVPEGENSDVNEENVDMEDDLEEEFYLSDVSSNDSCICDSDSDPSDAESNDTSYGDRTSPERIMKRVSGVMTDAATVRNPSSAVSASSLMNIPRVIVPVCTPTEQKVVEQLAISFRNDFNGMAAACNSIAQASSAMTLKTSPHIATFFNLRGRLARSTRDTSKNNVRRGHGGDRRSEKFKRAKAAKEKNQIDEEETKSPS